MSPAFRAKLVLMMINRYGYGQHVSDSSAYAKRCAALLRTPDVLRLNGDGPELEEIVDRLERRVDAGPVRHCLGGEHAYLRLAGGAMRYIVPVLLVLASACGDNRAPDAPAVEIVTGFDWRPEYDQALEVWTPVGFHTDREGKALESGNLTARECAPDWYELGDTDCTITVELAREANLEENYHARGFADRARRQIIIDARYTGAELVHVVAHEVGHVVLNAGHLEPGRVGVMQSGSSWLELTDDDLEHACNEINICRAR